MSLRHLTHMSAAIPALVPAKGSPEASRMWSDYVETCRALIGGQTKKDLPEGWGQPTLFPDIAGSQNDHAQPSVTAVLGVPRLDPVAEKIAVLYQKGSLVSIDKLSRIPPLEMPLNPEWFGIKSFRRVGTVSRRLSYRVSVLTEEELDIENKRKAMRNLLQRFSFSLADGQWWMPDSAKRLFEQEVERVNSEGIEQLQKIIGQDVEAFIEKRKAKVLQDAEEVYQEFYPGKYLPKSTADPDSAKRAAKQTQQPTVAAPSCLYQAPVFAWKRF